MEYHFVTSDPILAKKLFDFTVAEGGAVHASAAGSIAVPAGTPLVPGHTPAGAPAAAQPAAAPYTPPAAAAPAPQAPAPAAPPPAAAPAAHDAQDQAILAQGWTMDHIKSQATAMAQKQGANAGAVLKAALALGGVDKITTLPPKHYPAVHAALQQQS